jgi:hypothetical protein
MAQNQDFGFLPMLHPACNGGSSRSMILRK